MTRKRANAVSVQTKKIPKTLEIAPDKPKTALTPLNEKDGYMMQEMVNLSNNYAGLLKQQAQYDAMLYVLKLRKDQIKKGEIRLPMMIKVTNTLSYAESDKDKCLKTIEDEIKNLQLARDGIQGTLEYRKDVFVESLLRVKNILAEKTKGMEIQKVAGVYTKSNETKEQEKKMIEKEFEKLMKKDEGK